MTALLHALVNLARLRWLGATFCALAMLCVTTHAMAHAGATAHPRIDINASANITTTASATEHSQPKDRVWGFEQNSPLHVCALRPASLEHHQGILPSQRETASASSYAARGGTLPGSGPKGMVEVSAQRASSNYVKNFQAQKPVDFVYDPVRERFAMGNKYGHEWLAQGSDTAVGGTIWRDAGGVLRKDQSSGHLGHLWTPEIGQQFTGFMESFGVEVSHSATFVR